jgi:hypothetical protein
MFYKLHHDYSLRTNSLGHLYDIQVSARNLGTVNTGFRYKYLRIVAGISSYSLFYNYSHTEHTTDPGNYSKMAGYFGQALNAKVL